MATPDEIKESELGNKAKILGCCLRRSPSTDVWAADCGCLLFYETPDCSGEFHGVRGVALDSKGNLWVASNMSLDFPAPKIPDGASIMEQFKIAGAHLLKVLAGDPKMTTGVMNMIRPEGILGERDESSASRL